MNQLYVLTEELLVKIKELDPIDDSELMHYLSGEVQHLINRIDHNRVLSSEEKDIVKIRKETTYAFIKFYSYMILCDSEK